MKANVKRAAKNRPFRPKRKLFNPDEIVTTISQLLNRDLSSAQQLYGGGNSLQAFCLESQKSCTLKKYNSIASDDGKLEREAYSAFLLTNQRMGEVNRSFRVPRDIPMAHLTSHERMLKRARALVHWTVRDITWEELAENTTHSSGVTRGVKFSDTSLEAKFSWPLSSTQEVASLYRQYLVHDKLLCTAIQEMNLDRLTREGKILVEEYDIIEASRATTVPKTSTKRRMIAIEPTLNMYFQQSLMAILYSRLREVGLDVESLPQRHQDLAWQGSISGNFSTIDFASASDCVSIELLRYLLPPRWFEYVTKLRCPRMEILGETVELNMVSTMGNAGTFPLETLVFWAIGVATVMQRTRKNPYSLLSLPEERDLVSVFGDDCILPTVDAQAFMANAEAVGFSVNTEKSYFSEGPGFRESCGGDFYHGSYVRPLYIKAPTSTSMSALEPWLYIIMNATLKKYISYFGEQTYVYEKALLEYLFGLFGKHRLKIKLVPPGFPDDSGLQTADWRRLRACYNAKFSEVACSEQGWTSFRYCRFVYKTERARDEFLRYCIWLKKPIIRNDWWEPSLRAKTMFPVRKQGSYIVARTLSPTWDL